MARINIIVAASENGVIGNNNDLPWYLPTDLKYFKSITEGNIVIMGRKCWESIPESFKPLSNRLNIVLSKNKDYDLKEALLYNDLQSAINDYRLDDRDIFIIGGGKIYEEGFKIADTLYLTEINNNIEGDIYLNGYNKEDWKLIDKSNTIYENKLNFTFNKYISKNIKSIAIIGSKTFNDLNLLKVSMLPYLNKCDNMITSYTGGTSELAEKWADENGIKKLIFKPNFDKHGGSALSITNKTIIKNSDIIVCFWDGESKGTKTLIDLSYMFKKDILIVKF